MVSASGSLPMQLSYCISDPDSISSDDLFKISLQQLSKNLPQTTSSRATLFIYLRWLEVHRQNPSKRTDHWQNTLLHWAQSLRSRGFRESEIVATVEDWKDANGPFSSQWRRYPPSPKDIGKAFDEMEKKYRGDDRDRDERNQEPSLADRLDRPLGDSYRPKESGYGSENSPQRSRDEVKEAKMKAKKHKQENFEGKPPPNYICNRCGRKGHHLQVCPTNLDPAYDKPPPADYQCEICHARGKHFKSLCPRNSDPYSIIQKRRREGIETPYSNKGKVFREWKRETDEQKQVERRADRWREPTCEEGRLSKESSNASTAGSSPNPSLNDERRIKLEELEDKREKITKGSSADIDEIMGAIRFDGGGDNDRKRSRMHDQSSSSSTDASPAPNLGGRMRKKARTSDGSETPSSPLLKTKTGESSVYSPIFDNDSPREKDVDHEMDGSLEPNRGSSDGFEHNYKGGSHTMGCKLYNNGLYCPRADRTGGCPYFHDAEARKAALEKMNSRRSSGEHKMNPDALSIDGSETDTFDEMEVEVARTAKQYSDFVKKLMQNRPEMGERVNIVKRRPTAVDMWKLDDQRRMEEMTVNMLDLAEPSPPYSPFRLFRPEGEVASPTSNTSELSSPHVRMLRVEYAQLDGSCDERPVDENKVSPRKSSSSENKVTPRKSSSSDNRPSLHRKISHIGKEAIEKVRDLTIHVAEDLQTLKLRAVSPFRGPAQRAEELSPSKQGKKIAADTKDIQGSDSRETPNSLSVNAASLALNLTEENIKGLAQDTPRPVSHTSEHSFGSLVVNLPGDRPPKPRKPVTSNPYAQYAGPQSLGVMQKRDVEYNQGLLQENSAVSNRETSTNSDASELPSKGDRASLDRRCPALQEGKYSDGLRPSNITNLSKT